MANWEKLNEEWDKVFDTISDKEWDNWYNNLPSQKKAYKQSLSSRLEQLITTKRIQVGKGIYSKIEGFFTTDIAIASCPIETTISDIVPLEENEYQNAA